ncbi:MAG: DsbA family protein [Desulfobacterales bacterium]|nr:DsbA family protein [Desulfobacterales bacterium]
MQWKAFPLHPDTPEEGLSIDELFRQKGILGNVEQMMTQLQATAEKFGLPMGKRSRTYNSRKAQELGLWAQSKGRGHAFHDAAFRAYFVDGLNLFQSPVLLALVEKSGLDPEASKQVLDQGLFQDAVDADWEESRKRNVMAAPTYLMGEDRLVGAQSYEKLAWLVERNGARPRS